jgi:Iap family predicted aminopeptidase
LGDNVKGKIVLVKSATTLLRSAFVAYAKRYEEKDLDKLPDTYMLGRGMLEFYVKMLAKENKAQQYLQQKGAVALLSMNGTGRDGTLFVDGTPAYAKGYDAPIPQVVVSTEDYMRLQRLLADKKDVELEMNIQNKWYNDDLQGYNVIGEIPGTDPALKTQVVMLGGHLDSWHSGTGATDNGAGCIVMMEALRILKALGVQPKRTVRIALWGGEEEGLLGSFGYVKKHFGNPADMKLSPEQKNISVYFNLDNGSGKIRGIYLQNNEAVGPIFKSWLQPFADLDATGVTKSNTGSTDHLSFDAVGIPAFQFIQDPLEYETRTHHSNMDVYDHLQIADLKQAAQVVAGFIYNAAMRDEMIPRKPLPKAERFVFDTDEPL